MTYAEELGDQAQAVETPAQVPTKKERKPRTTTPKEPKLYPQWNEDGSPLLNEEGTQVQGEVKMKRPKVVKPVEYVKDEEGNLVLDENGQPIPAKKVRAPRLDAEGNPIPRTTNVFLGSQTLKITDAGREAKYQPESQRGKIFASITDGMTVDQFYEANGGKAVSHTFLVWYVTKAGVVEVE